ncbi:MAG: hypothetical protein K5790_01525 [Nitrosopumilus sp.]|uniref:hypothetical protein n=1 Tax=Nitrosopumilus sp. TaxID=2024843 RepID=UPI00247D85E7|nr:hypothetical protein [Nitrosopumilus sp.]MCV0391954.1 hypothetical protein [Nitrosopumilus sp.]
MKYFLIFIILIGFLIPSITFAQYLGDVEFYHLPLTVESKQYSILAQSNTNHFTDVVYDSKAHSLIFLTSLSEDFIDTYTITMNVQTFSEVLATDYAKTSDSMVVLVNGVDQPYKTIEDNEIISWIFYAPISSDEVELLPSSPRFGTGTYKFDKIPNGSPKIYPPLKQDHVGIATENIQCKDELLLLQKYDGSPACVKPESINILVHRGWADEKFRTLPIIDFQNPDRIFREVGYLGLMMLLPHIEENQTVAISLEGKPNMILPIIQYYEIEILSEKTNTKESFSSVFGKITKSNLQKFFEENPMNLFVKRGVLMTSLGGYQDNIGTYGPFNQFLTDNESQIIGDALTYYENKRTNGEDVHFDDFVKWPTGKLNESFLQKSKLLDIARIGTP